MTRVCMIGATGHVGYVTECLDKAGDIQIVGASPGSEGETVDPLVKKLRQLRPKEPLRVFDDYTDMLDELRPDIAVVACWFGDHARIAADLMQRGIHAFVEKPIATTREGLQDLSRAYDASDANLGAMFGLRYAPWMYTAWRAVQAGTIGEVRLINTRKSYRLGKRGQPYLERGTYGGTIPWVGSHAIDWIHWFGRKRFREVYASHSRRNNRGHGDLETTALCHFVLEDELLASATIDYLRPDAAPTHGDDRVRVVGTGGVVEVIGAEVWIIDDSGQRKLALEKPGRIFPDFVDRSKGNDIGLIRAEDAFTVTEACLLARESADTGEVVHFPGSCAANGSSDGP